MLHPFVQAVSPRRTMQVSVRSPHSPLGSPTLCCASRCLGRAGQHRLGAPADRRQATRNSHMVLATLTLAFGPIHVFSFLFLTDSNDRHHS